MSGPRVRGAFNLPALAAAVEARRRARDISYGAVARESGVNRQNLAQRLARSGSLDVETFLRLLLWLGETDVTPYVNTAGEVAMAPGSGPAGAAVNPWASLSVPERLRASLVVIADGRRTLT